MDKKPEVKEVAGKPKKPVSYRYTGFEDIWVGGREVRHGSVVIGDETYGDLYAGDKRFEKVADEK